MPAIGLLLLATALAVLVTAGVPFALGGKPVNVQDWLGFAGALIGAAGTIIAGIIAWRAAQRTIDSDRKLDARREQAVYEVIQIELRPFVDLYVLVWRIVVRAMAGDAEVRRNGIGLAKTIAGGLAVDRTAADILELAKGLDPLRQRRLFDVIQGWQMLDKFFARPEPYDNFWLLGLQTMLSHFERYLSHFDPEAAHKFDGFAKAPVDHRSTAEHLLPLVVEFEQTGNI